MPRPYVVAPRARRRKHRKYQWPARRARPTLRSPRQYRLPMLRVYARRQAAINADRRTRRHRHQTTRTPSGTRSLSATGIHGEGRLARPDRRVHGRKAVAAIHRAVTTRLKRYGRRRGTLRANRVEHFALSTLATRRTLRLAHRATVAASLRLVLEA